ncbi:MAG: hypothetical protein ACRD1V_11060 [Vicinamibacterales bacterium]
MLNALRSAVDGLQRDSAVQFKRIAQLQADVDSLKTSVNKLTSV